MNRSGFWLGLTVGTMLTCLLAPWSFSVASKEAGVLKGIAPELVADYVHSVVQADRTFYETAIVERMQIRGLAFASENWRDSGDLPLPAQFLLESGQLVAKHGSGIQFRLISDWAINKKNLPATEFEQAGLKKLLVNPARPSTGVTTEGTTRVFQAIYPDKAVTQKCADCHNVHPKSSRRDFKAGDIMGGVLIKIPLP
ncbi:Tll0287-like domain-containing protein [Petrachloros mirabilis]